MVGLILAADICNGTDLHHFIRYNGNARYDNVERSIFEGMCRTK